MQKKIHLVYLIFLVCILGTLTHNACSYSIDNENILRSTKLNYSGLEGGKRYKKVNELTITGKSQQKIACIAECVGILK